MSYGETGNCALCGANSRNVPIRYDSASRLKICKNCDHGGNPHMRREVRTIRKGQDIRIHTSKKGIPTYNHVQRVGDVDILHSKQTGLYLAMRGRKQLAYSESKEKLARRYAQPQRRKGIGENLLDIAGGL